MFDVGFWEILLILILALVIIGPERLPAAARQAGLFVGKARRYIEGVRSEVESELDVTEFKRMLHNQEVQINELQQQLKAGVDEVKADLPDSNVLSDLHGLNDTAIHDHLADNASAATQASSDAAENTLEDAGNAASSAKNEKI
ncbi:MAG: twin-arginine translocase subunit TatB [Proteobacteria bacterium]|nr:twin-arginine translocase subunit TatB [Pseudomonadota bacterium]